MPDHPIDELHDMKGDVWGGHRHTRIAIVLCSVIAVLALLVFALFDAMWVPAAAPADPIQRGAATAFDVAPATPSAPPPAPPAQPIEPYLPQ